MPSSTSFGEASRRAKAELAQDSPRRTYWEQRFRTQLSRLEHLDPSDPSSPLRKQYQQLHPFVRATIYYALKALDKGEHRYYLYARMLGLQ